MKLSWSFGGPLGHKILYFRKADDELLAKILDDQTQNCTRMDAYFCVETIVEFKKNWVSIVNTTETHTNKLLKLFPQKLVSFWNFKGFGNPLLIEMFFNHELAYEKEGII